MHLWQRRQRPEPQVRGHLGLTTVSIQASSEGRGFLDSGLRGDRVLAYGNLDRGEWVLLMARRQIQALVGRLNSKERKGESTVVRARFLE